MQPRVEIVTVEAHCSHEDISVSVQVLGDRVNRDVSAQFERSLQQISFSVDLTPKPLAARSARSQFCSLWLDAKCGLSCRPICYVFWATLTLLSSLLKVSQTHPGGSYVLLRGSWLLRNRTQLTHVHTFLGVLRSQFKLCRLRASYQCVHPISLIME